MTRTLIQIVPQWSAAPEGVGDYARLLAERLLQDHDWRSIFVAGTPLPMAERRLDEWESHALARRDAVALLETLATLDRTAPVVLHLSAYGYQRRGIPFWLASALERWRRANPGVPLITIFHELFATGPVWRSAFWLGPLQARIARRIRRLSTGGVATTEPYAGLLDRWPADFPSSIIALPVFSTVGETPAITPATTRKRTLAVFGRAAAAQALYRHRLADIAAFVSANGIDEILDLGHRIDAPPALIGAAPVRALGALPGDQVRAVLADALFGVVEYDADRLAKSTIFAAYCANGVIPLCFSDRPGRNDGLRPGVDYLKLPAPPGSPAAPPLEKLQRNARDWYRPHALGNGAAVIARLLGPAPGAAAQR